MTVHPASRRVLHPDPVTALRDLGLSAAADPQMERFAERVRDQLGVPVALVCLVDDQRQVFPGARGLPRPWDEQRAAPLADSLCHRVATTGLPVVVADARSDPLLAQGADVSELGIVAYAGFPLADDDGRVLGSLCGIDTVARDWTDVQLRRLGELAQDCRDSLCLRLSRLEARREREESGALEARLQAEIERSRRMLSVAESLNQARTVEGIASRLSRELSGSPGLASVRLHLPEDLAEAPSVPAAALQCARGSTQVTGERTTYAPVVGSAGLLGVLELRWLSARDLDETERTGVAALASHVAQALERASLIERRIGVAHQLQAAMLPTLPVIPGLLMAGCYVPAGAEEWVGGDWYDAIPLAPVNEGVDRLVAVTVGDVTGHDIPAAAVMGQARAMLRQAAFDRPGDGPADVFTRFERACAALGVEASGSAVLAFLEHSADADGWRMTWTSAGHPPPLLVLADGRLQRLELGPDEQGLLFGYRDLYDVARTDARVELPPGSTVLFYSDGVIEVPGLHLDEQIDELGDLLRETHHRGPQAVVDSVSMQFGSGHDDVVALAVQVPGLGGSTPAGPAASSRRAPASTRSPRGTRPPRPRPAPG